MSQPSIFSEYDPTWFDAPKNSDVYDSLMHTLSIKNQLIEEFKESYNLDLHPLVYDVLVGNYKMGYIIDNTNWNLIWREIHNSKQCPSQFFTLLQVTQETFQLKDALISLGKIKKTKLYLECTKVSHKTLKKSFPEFWNKPEVQEDSSGVREDYKGLSRRLQYLRYFEEEEMFLDKFVYIIETRQIYYFNGKLWVLDTEDFYLNREVQKVWTWINGYEKLYPTTPLRKEMILHMDNFNRIIEERNDFKLPEHMFPAFNYLLDYRRGYDQPELINYSIEYYATVTSPISWDESIDLNDPLTYPDLAPFEFFTSLYPEGMKKFEQYNANTIHCSNPSDSIVHLVGPGGCGKSTLIRMLMKMYKPIAATVNVSAMNGDFGCTGLVDRQINLIPEYQTTALKEKAIILLKNLTGDAGVQMLVNKKYVPEFYYTFPDFFMITASNALPKLRGDHSGIPRRLVVIEMLQKIVDMVGKKDPLFHEKLYKLLPYYLKKWGSMPVKQLSTSEEEIEEYQTAYHKWSNATQYIMDRLFLPIDSYSFEDDGMDLGTNNQDHSISSVMEYISWAMERQGRKSNENIEREVKTWCIAHGCKYRTSSKKEAWISGCVLLIDPEDLRPKKTKKTLTELQQESRDVFNIKGTTFKSNEQG